MFTFQYKFAAGPPQWKDLPCFIQKALRKFVTESEVVYDRNFFLKKFGIIVKNPIIPYKTSEFNKNILLLCKYNKQPNCLRHFSFKTRSLLKKYIPLYRSLREKIEKNILSTPTVKPLEQKVFMSDERVVTLAHVIGPVYTVSNAYAKKDIPAMLCYYSQKLLCFHRSLCDKNWLITKFDRRTLSQRLMKMWNKGLLPFPEELRTFSKSHSDALEIVEPIYKLKHLGRIGQFHIDLPHLGIVDYIGNKKWYREYSKFYYIKNPASEIIESIQQIKSNSLVRRELSNLISRDEQFSIFIPRIASLNCRSSKIPAQMLMKNSFNSMFGLRDEVSNDVPLASWEGEFYDHLRKNPASLAKYQELARLIGKK